MNVQRAEGIPGWGPTAAGGAMLGAVAASAYALAFLGYAALRATARLLVTPDIDAGLVATITATWVSLAVPVAVFAALCALPAAVVGSLTALLLRAVLRRVTVARGRVPAGLLSGSVCLVLGLALLALLARGLGLVWTSGTAETLIFWLVLPLALYTVIGALAGCRLSGRLRTTTALEASRRALDNPTMEIV